MLSRIRTGHPGQISDGYDDQRIMAGLGIRTSHHQAPAVRGYSYSIKGGPAPPRPPREFLESHYDSAPAVQPPPRNPKRLLYQNPKPNQFRPTSSVYSQHSQRPTSNTAAAVQSSAGYGHSANLASHQSYRYGGGDEISPPSSPEPDHYQGRNHRDRTIHENVSPIEEDGPRPDWQAASQQLQQQQQQHPKPRRPSQTGPQAPSISGPNARQPLQNRPATNIPMMRRARRKQSDAALRETQNNNPREQMGAHHTTPQKSGEEPRWDPLTGERTTSSQGRPSQVKPAEFAQGLGSTSQNSAMPPKSPQEAGSTFGDKVRKMAKKAAAWELNSDLGPSPFTSSRPAWRGASGRTAVVDPVKDTPEVAPLRIPAKSNRRVVSSTAAPYTRTVPSPGLSARGATPPISPPPPGPETTARSATHETQTPIRKEVPPPQRSVSATVQQSQEAQRYPSPPLSGTMPGRDAPSVAAQELAREGFPHIRAPAPIPASPVNPNPVSENNLHEKSAIRRKPPPAHANHQYHDSLASSVYSQPDPPAPTPAAAPPVQNPDVSDTAPAPTTTTDGWVQPPSRFSVTTYATSAAETPRESLDGFGHNQDRPPVPSIPAGIWDSPQVGAPGPKSESNSIMDRSRPKLEGPFSDGSSSVSASPKNSPSPVVVSFKEVPFTTSPYYQDAPPRDRKPVGSGGQKPPLNPVVARVRSDGAAAGDRPTSSASSINKSLPPVPPEASAGEAHDRVGVLNAQLAALGNRRININRSIKQMTELMPTDKLMNSEEVQRKRELEKKRIETLKLELAEVQREEYELGLKLHRAYKRMDNGQTYEPTTLWVRRVTG